MKRVTRILSDNSFLCKNFDFLCILFSFYLHCVYPCWIYIIFLTPFLQHFPKKGFHHQRNPKNPKSHQRQRHKKKFQTQTKQQTIQKKGWFKEHPGIEIGSSLFIHPSPHHYHRPRNRNQHIRIPRSTFNIIRIHTMSSLKYSSILLSLSLLLSILPTFTTSFYLPGVAPKDYVNGASIDVDVNSLSSNTTVIPYDFYLPQFGFCRPDVIESRGESLGSVLFGDRLKNAPFSVGLDSFIYSKWLSF